MKTMLALALLPLPLGFATGCVRVKTDPIEVKPIHITVDVNVRVARELDSFFDDIDRTDPSMQSPPPAQGTR
ncbi:MAG: hypothetical protein JXR77_04695 [Lentisphaeria bacterium]|nr:hypothetical protein [Lentisphaeria bacterium]